MVVLLGLFYFGQDGRLRDERAVCDACDLAARWVLGEGFINVLIVINNECGIDYSHEILKPYPIHELIEHVRLVSIEGRRLLDGTSFGGNSISDE